MDDLLLPIFILLLCGCASSGNQYLASDWQHMTNESTHAFMGDDWAVNKYSELSNFIRCGAGNEC